jgi:diguanylate cyclase (GGDEF)-like protein
MVEKSRKKETSPDAGYSESLGQVLAESERLKDTVAKCGDEVSSVNAVLDTKVEVHDPRSDIGNALQKSKSVEIDLLAISEDMSAVNTALKNELKQRQELEQKLIDAEEKERVAIHAAFHDPLTDLPNRALFNERLEHGLEQAKRHDWQLAVMFLDLDGFKGINDTYGHDVGDRLLQTLSQRLKASTRADDTVCRVGGDEFLYLLTEVRSERDTTLIAEKLLKLIQAPCHIDGHDLVIRSSIGIAIFPKDGRTPGSLVKCADKAMYHAKKTKSGYSLTQ